MPVAAKIRPTFSWAAGLTVLALVVFAGILLSRSTLLSKNQTGLLSVQPQTGTPLPLQVEFPDRTRGTIANVNDCVRIENDFLVDWCRRTIAFTRGDLPTGALSARDNVTFYAALAAAELESDLSICDEPSVAHWVAIGSGTTDGGSACRSAFSSTNLQGWFSVSDPDTGATVVVSMGSWPPPIE